MTDDFDPFSDENIAVNEKALGRAGAMLSRYLQMSSEAEDLSTRLKQVQAEMRKIQEKDLPDLLIEAGVKSFEAGGVTVRIVSKLYGSLPKDQEAREVALSELRAHGGDDLLKTEVTVVGASEELWQRLVKEGWSASIDQTVHPQTLLAWARRQLAAGEAIDLDKLGIYQRRFADIR